MLEEVEGQLKVLLTISRAGRVSPAMFFRLGFLSLDSLGQELWGKSVWGKKRVGKKACGEKSVWGEG